MAPLSAAIQNVRGRKGGAIFHELYERADLGSESEPTSLSPLTRRMFTSSAASSLAATGIPSSRMAEKPADFSERGGGALRLSSISGLPSSGVLTRHRHGRSEECVEKGIRSRQDSM